MGWGDLARYSTCNVDTLYKPPGGATIIDLPLLGLLGYVLIGKPASHITHFPSWASHNPELQIAHARMPVGKVRPGNLSACMYMHVNNPIATHRLVSSSPSPGPPPTRMSPCWHTSFHLL